MASIDFKHTPYGDLALISMRGCEDIASQVDYYLKQWRNIPEDESFVIPQTARVSNRRSKSGF